MLDHPTQEPGTAYLLDQFRRAGYAVTRPPMAAARGGSALISRVQIRRDLTPEIADVSIPCRVSVGVLDSEPQVAVLGMYVPSRDRSEAKTERKRRFISSLIDACDSLPAAQASHLVIGGDYNVIAPEMATVTTTSTLGPPFAV